MYDDLNLDEEEEKFGRLITEEHDSDASDDASEGVFSRIHPSTLTLKPPALAADLPPRTPSKKHDEESMSSSKRDDSSPILKKAGAALQLRSTCLLELGLGSDSPLTCFYRAFHSRRRCAPLPHSPSQLVAYNALVPSTQATAKSKLCATADVKHTQGRFATVTAPATIKVCNCGRCSCNTFRESTEQRVIIVNNITSCTCTRTCTLAAAAETRTCSEYGVARPYHCRNFFAKPDPDFHVEPISVIDLCICATARR